MRIYWLKLLAVCHHLINLVTIIIVIVEMFVTWHLVNTCLKGDMNLYRWKPLSPTCHVWWSLVYNNWGCKVFNMSRYLTNSRDRGIKELHEWELFMVYHHFPKFSGHKYCSSKNWFLVFHVIKKDHVIKGSVN